MVTPLLRFDDTVVNGFQPSYKQMSLAPDAFVRTNRRDIAMMFVCLSGTGVHCDHTVHCSADLSYGWIVQCSGYPDTHSRLSLVPHGKEMGYEYAN